MSDEAEETPEQKTERLEREMEDRALRLVMGTPEGRRFVWRLIEDVCGVFSGSYCGEATHETAHQEGRRAVGREVLLEVQRVAPQGYLLALQEAMSAQRAKQE